MQTDSRELASLEASTGAINVALDLLIDEVRSVAGSRDARRAVADLNANLRNNMPADAVYALAAGAIIRLASQ